MTEFVSKWKYPLLALAGIFILICLVLFAGLGLSVFRAQNATPTATVEPDVFNYCGAQLTSLCVLSFGRDAFGQTVINLYVPPRTYPLFYLKLLRATGESEYVCTANKTVKTSVYCVGDALNLGEGLVMQLLAEKDNRLLAQGDFTLKAFLVPSVVVDDDESGSDSPEPASTSKPTSTPTQESTPTPFDFFEGTFVPTSNSTDTTVTVTPTSTSQSYPNYP